MYFKLKDQKKLYYESTAPLESGESIILINGLTQSTVAWNGVKNLLKNRIQVLSTDLIFQGSSDKEGPYQSLEEQGNNIVELVKHLGLKKPHLMGISLGGLIAQRMMVNSPEIFDRVILVSSFCQKTPRFKHIEQGLQKAIKIGGLPLLIDFMYPLALPESFYQSPPLPLEALIELTIANNDQSSVQHLMDAVDSFDDYSGQLGSVANKVLILQGELDCFVTPEMGKALAEAITNSEYQLMAGLGHTINVENPKALADKVLEFIKL